MPQMSLREALEMSIQQLQGSRPARAESICRQILAAQPNQPDALHLLGVIAYRTGRLDMAEDMIRQAIAVAPELADFHGNLGQVLAGQGRKDAALAEFREALRLNPNSSPISNNLGNVLMADRRFDEAIAAYRQALASEANSPEVHNNLANALRSKGLNDDALQEYQRALGLRPNYAESHNNMGSLLHEMGRLDEAITAYRQALAYGSQLSAVWYNLGLALREKGDISQSIPIFQQAIALTPNEPLIHYNFALALLLNGDFQEGWEEYEWRTRSPEIGGMPREFPQPQWDGSDPAGRTILLYAEQDHADSLQFSRYASLLTQRGAKVILQCAPELLRLFKSLSGVEKVIVQTDPLPDFDLHCPLPSLPRAFKTTLPSIPSAVPYLHADKQLVLQWKNRLAGETRRKIGILWTNARHSVPIDALVQLAQIKDTNFYNLGPNPASAADTGLNMTDWTADLSDFADMAALVENLDLIITLDSPLAHLAGALNKPVWLLLPPLADWRWMLDRQDSPWYPSMRLFREPNRDWNRAIERVVSAVNS